LGLIAMSLLLAGCGTGQQASAPASSSPVPAATTASAAVFVPDIVGQTPGQVANVLALDNVTYDYYQDGTKIHPGGTDQLIITSTEPKAGESLPAGTTLKINTKAKAKPTPTPTPTPTATGYAATVPAKFPGYPLIVHGASLDYRIKFAFEGKLVDDQVVALAPGLYTPYNPRVTDLLTYYVHTGVYGDSALKNAYMPDAGGATWPGVLPGPEEPK
jgi:hypothetical protein